MLLLATAAELYLQTLLELEDLRLELLYLLTPTTLPLPEGWIEGAYELESFPPRRFGMRVLWPVVEDLDGDLVSGQGTKITADETSTTAKIIANLERFGRLGFVDPGVTFEVERTLPGDGTAQFDVAVESTADSKVNAEVLVTIDNNTVKSLGTLTPDTPQRLTDRIAAGAFDVRVEVRFVTAGDPFFEDAGIDFDFLPPSYEQRIATVGMGNEAVDALSVAAWNATHPTDPASPGDIPLILAGDHHMEMGRLTPIDYQSFQSRAQPVVPFGRTYLVRDMCIPPDSEYYDLKPGLETSHDVVAALIAVGDWGLSIANYDDGASAYGPDVVVDTGNMTDLTPFDGNPETGQAVYVDNSADAIKLVTRDATNQFVIDPAATIANTAWPGASGNVVSAFRHASGDLLIVTDGAPGELWVLPSGQSIATRIGTVGTAPRRVRAAGNIAAVSAYGSALGFGSLTIFVRDASGTWGYAPFSKSGARSVGIDVRQLPNGNVAIAYTSFLGNVLLLTVVDGTDGGILVDNAYPLPSGSTNPGHCTFVEDGGQAVLVSCNGSDTVVLIPVEFVQQLP